MKPAVARLLLTVALFVAWLGYLGYLVVCRPHTPPGLGGAFVGRPLTLSQPQFLVSSLDVVAEMSGDNGEDIVVKEVLFPAKDAPIKPEETIRLEQMESWRDDYAGPGRYLLALQSYNDNKGVRRFQIAPIPPSPGFIPSQSERTRLHIYPATKEMLAEYRQIAKP
jgi:hypothetical protein